MNILSLYARKGDATSFYRGVLPMNELSRIDSDIKIIEKDKVGWMDLPNIDMVFYQRPHEENSKLIMEICRRNNKKIVIDHDDLLSAVPKENPFHIANKDKDYKKIYKDIIQLSNGVILSTQFLLDELKKYRYITDQKTCVVNNGFNDYLFELKNSFSDYNKCVLWRGTATHNVDFAPYKNEVIDLIKNNRDFVFIFIGYLPFREIRTYSNVVYKDVMDPVYYMHAIKKLQPSLGFYPLLDVPFNKAKSNIYKIELTYAGAVVMSPDFDEWKWNSDNQFMFDKKNLFKKMDKAIDMIRNKDEAIKQEYDNNFNYLKENLLLSNLNKIRLEFLRSFNG